MTAEAEAAAAARSRFIIESETALRPATVEFHFDGMCKFMESRSLAARVFSVSISAQTLHLSQRHVIGVIRSDRSSGGSPSRCRQVFAGPSVSRRRCHPSHSHPLEPENRESENRAKLFQNLQNKYYSLYRF